MVTEQKGNNKESYQLSNLQKEIMRYVSVTKGADYESIAMHTRKYKTTVAQSLSSLKRRLYVQSLKTLTQKNNRKLIFRLTNKGLFYSIGFLDVDIDAIIKNTGTPRELDDYMGVIQSILDKDRRKQFLKQCAKLIVEKNLFNDKGELITLDGPEAAMLTNAMRDSVIELAKNPEFEPKELLDDQTFEHLEAILSHQELQDIQRYLFTIATNLDSVATKLHAMIEQLTRRKD